MPRRRMPDRITEDLGGHSTFESWAITNPLDVQVARIEREWGSIEAWLSETTQNNRELWVEDWASLNDAIPALDLKAQRKLVKLLLHGIRMIDSILTAEPPDSRFMSIGDFTVCETMEDANKLGVVGVNVIILEEIPRLMELVREHYQFVYEAKEMGGTVTRIGPSTMIPEGGDDIPFE